MPLTATREALRCSFCNKDQNTVRKLVAGSGVFICNECVDLCNQILASDDGPEEPSAPASLKLWEGLSDEQLLQEMVRAHAAHDNVDRAVRRHVAALRERGITWARIGEALGMARQSAWEHFSGEE